jgi:hypothetical protein
MTAECGLVGVILLPLSEDNFLNYALPVILKIVYIINAND